MIQLYGIKTCGSVKKAMQFFTSKNIAYAFIDLKKEGITREILESWLKFVTLEILLNKQGTTYKKLGLKNLQLDSKSIKAWLLKEPMLLKRPIIVDTNRVIVGFNADTYAKIWLKD